MRKLILFGDKNDSYQYIQQNLGQQEYELEIHATQENIGQIKGLQNADVIIIDVSPQSIRSLEWFLPIREAANFHNIPLLALVDKDNVRLRYRLVKFGIDDYLTLPPDKLDLRVRINMLIRNRSKPASPQRGFVSTGTVKYTFQKFNQLIERLNAPFLDFNYYDFIADCLQTLSLLLETENVYLFKVINDSWIESESSVHPFYTPDDWKIDIDDFQNITKCVRLKESTVLNQINQENPLHIYLKSYLNLDINAYMIYPIVEQEKTTKLIMAFRTDNGKFHDIHFRDMEIITKIIEISQQMRTGRDELEEKFDGQVWKYSYEFLDHIINQLNFGILVIDHQKRVKYLNKQAATLLGLNIENALLGNLESILGSKNARKIFSSVQIEEGTYERPEIELENERGENTLIGFTTSRYLDNHSGEKGFLVSLKDITYSKEMQEEMRRMDRLASLGVMASGIAHEIRNPLAGIKAIAQTFEEELDKDDPKVEFVTRIIKQVNRLDDLLKTLFSYAKPQKPNRRLTSVDGILQEVLALLRQKLQQQNIKLSQTYAASLPQIYIDGAQIQQVLFNLILNSIEAISTSGDIQINIEPVERISEMFQRKPFFNKITENPYLLIHIKDTGCGIEKEDLQQIFNPFFTTKAFGTGLGLSIVYQIVKENDGIIYFDSKSGHGTNCYLFLPAYQPTGVSNTGVTK